MGPLSFEILDPPLATDAQTASTLNQLKIVVIPYRVLSQGVKRWISEACWR